MLKVAVLVSGGGTNLQAIIDAMDNGTITNAKIEVVISNNPNAYALERARKHNIKALCISPKSYENRAAFNADFLEKLNEYKVDLVLLAVLFVVSGVRLFPEKKLCTYIYFGVALLMLGILAVGFML